MSQTLEIAQWVAQIVLAAFLLIVVVIDARRVKVEWLSVLFFVMLVTVIIRRVDDLAAVFGRNIVSVESGMVLSWAVLGVLAFGKWELYIHAAKMREIERTIQEKNAMMSEEEVAQDELELRSDNPFDRLIELELMRRRNERNGVGYDWDHIPSIPRVETKMKARG